MSMIKHISKRVSIFSLLMLLSLASFSQDKTIISPYLTFQYFKDSDNHRFLQTILTYSFNRMELPLPDMEISFSHGSPGGDQQVSVKTDTKGFAKLPLDDSLVLPVDKDGFWLFTTEFKGNDSIEAASAGLLIKDVNLKMSLSEADSIKTITLNATVTEEGEVKPVADEIIYIYVPRMFSMLSIGEVTLDGSGTASIEFPADLPGDEEGNITIIAKFEENPLFGNVENKILQQWGLPKENYSPSTHRALWTKTAPRWMIYTLSVLLTGVWGHYLFAIISLILIRKDAKKQLVNNNEKILK